MLRADEWLFQAINGLAGKLGPLDRVMAFLANDYFVVLLMAFTVLAVWFIGETPDRRYRLQTAVLWTAGGIAISNGFIGLFNSFIFRPRPFVYLPAHMLFYLPHDSSFPSNAAAVGFAAAFGIWLVHRKIGWAMLILAALFAFSRVFVGVHFPLDVVAGAVLGVVASYVSFMACQLLRPLLSAFLSLARLLRLA